MAKRHREEEEEEKQNLSLELTVLSAESLKSSSVFPFSLNPYVSISTPFAPDTIFSTCTGKTSTSNPTFNQTFHVPLNTSFFNNSNHHSNDVHVSIWSKRPLLLGPIELGCCKICVNDIMDGYHPLMKRRRLSYSLRSSKHGSKGHGYVHVAARVVGPGVDRLTIERPVPQQGWSRVAIGIPVGVPVPVQGMVASVPIGFDGEVWGHKILDNDSSLKSK